MESMNQHQDHQDSKSSNDDHEEGDGDRISDVNDEAAGTGRSYECVFCKRGFTTAQALGGHMNIHRKERAKTRPTSAPTNLMTSTTSIISKAGVDHHDHLGDLMRSYRSIQSYPPPYSTALAAPNASWIVRPPPPHANSHEKEEELCARNFVYLPRHQNLLRDDHRDWRSESGLSLGIGRPSRDDDRAVDDNKERVLVTEGDDELDLELRLGHDP